MDKKLHQKSPHWFFLATALAALIVEFQLFGFWVGMVLVLVSAALIGFIAYNE
jgi:hypothetical protein